MNAPLHAGVELGGTKCIAILGRGPGSITAMRTVPTGSPGETLGALRSILGEWRDEYRFASLGIGSFGPIDLRTGRMAATPKPGWEGAGVRDALSRDLGVPTAIETDVTGAALAEARWGSAAGLESLAYVTVGTGVGAGLIVGGKPVHGLSHPEMGHMRVKRLDGDAWPGSCPFHGDCVEGLASGPAIQARLGRGGETAAPGDPVWDFVSDALAQLISNVVLVASPQRVVLGGGVIVAQPHLLPRIRDRLGQHLGGYCAALASREAREAFVTQSRLGDQVGPLGALAIALQA